MDKKTSIQKQIKYCADSIISSLKEWEYLRIYGGQDPFWPDGANMNLVRNHILFYKRELEELCIEVALPDAYYMPTPPEVDNDYLAPEGEYFEVRKKSIGQFGKISTMQPENGDTNQQELF